MSIDSLQVRHIAKLARIAMSDAEIDAALTNLCRCGIYPRVKKAIRRAQRIIAGMETLAAAPPPGISPEDAARSVPALTPVIR